MSAPTATEMKREDAQVRRAEAFPITVTCDQLGCDGCDKDDLRTCERETCDKRVCHACAAFHGLSRATYVLCQDCDRAESLKLEAVILPALDKLSDKVRRLAISAEDIQEALANLLLETAEVEGGK